MRYHIFILFLVAIIMAAGCVGGNKETNVTSTPTEKPILTLTTNTSIVVTPNYSTITQTISTIAEISTNGNLKNGQIQCGESRCPPNWFCCNNVCYDPNDDNTGFCCGNKVCPTGWRCLQTKTGMTCSAETYLDSKVLSEICDLKFPGSFSGHSDDSIYGLCEYGWSENNNCNKYPTSCLNSICVVPGLYPFPDNTVIEKYQAKNLIIDDTYCVQNYPGTHYNPSSKTCMCYYNERSCPYDHTGPGCAF